MEENFTDGPILTMTGGGGGNAVPTVITDVVTSITTTTATCGGNVTSAGTPASVTARGIVWSTSPGTSFLSYVGMTSDGNGLGTYTSYMTPLIPGGITYYVKAYATNSFGTGYGNENQFSTNIPPQDIGTQISTQISVAAASLSTSVMNDIFSQDATLESAISANLSTENDTLAAAIVNQFANRRIT